MSELNYLEKKGKENRQKINLLEKIAKTAASFIAAIPLYLNSPILHNQPTKDYESQAPINEVSQRDLPPGVLGFYSPSSHNITSLKDVSTDTKSYIKSHESYHALWNSSEQHADSYAMARTGHFKRTFLHPYYLGYEI